MNTWLIALKQWNRTQAKYTVPKKGTKGYGEVKAIQKRLEGKHLTGGAAVATPGANQGLFNAVEKVHNSLPYQLLTMNPLTGARSAIEFAGTTLLPLLGNGKRKRRHVSRKRK